MGAKNQTMLYSAQGQAPPYRELGGKGKKNRSGSEGNSRASGERLLVKQKDTRIANLKINTLSFTLSPDCLAKC